MKNFIRAVAAFACLVGLAGQTSAADWGSIKGKFVVDGSVGEPAAINVNKDTEYCGKHNLVDETIVVGDGNGLANMVVFIYTRKALEVHPDYEAAAKEPVTLDNNGCHFVPHVMALRTGQPLEIKNSDPGIGHNTNATFVANPTFNEMVANATPITKTLTKAEPIPASVACNVHPWMKGYIVLREDPYVGISNENGEFEIKNIPVGQHEFIFWHEAKGNMRDLALKEGKTDRRGRAKFKIVAGETLDLGEIKVKTAALGK
jgi:plastocyanin